MWLYDVHVAVLTNYVVDLRISLRCSNQSSFGLPKFLSQNFSNKSSIDCLDINIFMNFLDKYYILI